MKDADNKEQNIYLTYKLKFLYSETCNGNDFSIVKIAEAHNCK